MFTADWGLLCLGLLIGIVGTVSAMLAFVDVEHIECKAFENINGAVPDKGVAPEAGGMHVKSWI